MVSQRKHKKLLRKHIAAAESDAARSQEAFRIALGIGGPTGKDWSGTHQELADSALALTDEPQ